MLGGAVLLGATAFLLASTGVGFAALPFLADGMEALAVGGLSMEAGAIASALTSNRGMAITTRQTAAARQVIYGQQRVGGVEIYRSTTGSSHDQFNYVIVLSGHEDDSLVNLYLDGRQVHWQGSGDGWVVRNGVGFGGIANGNTYTGPNGVQYNFGGTGHSGIYCEARFGDQLDGDVIGALTANDANWAATADGSPWVAGCCYIYLKIEYNASLFPTEPEIRVTVNGKNNIYDPRTGATGFTTNWALLCADVLTDPIYGLGDLSVNQEQLIAAANVCDEQVPLAAGGTEARYTTNYHTDTTASPGDLLSTMMTGAAGRLSQIGGEWYIWPAYWQGPSFTFDDNALTGELAWTPYRPYRDLINRVNGTYIAPTYPYNIAGNLYDANGFYNGQIQDNFPFAWQPTNYPQYACDILHGYASDQYLNADTPSLGAWDSTGATTYHVGDVVSFDNEFYQATIANNSTAVPSSNTTDWRSYAGAQLPKELAFSTVISVSQAQRVAKINLLRNRQQGSGTFPMSLSAWQMQPCDVMQFTMPAMGWTEKSLEIVGVSFSVTQTSEDNAQKVRATMTVQETDPSVYEWSTIEELTVYDVPALPSQSTYYPAPPTNMSLTSGLSTAVVALDGSITPRIEVQWDTPLDILTTQIQVQYVATSDTAQTWLAGPMVDVGSNLAYISGVVAGQQYNVRIRGIRANGATSAWEEIDGYTVSITLSVIGILALAPGSLVADAFDDGTADIIVSGFTAVIGNASVSVLPAGPFTLTGMSQQTLYWVYYIDPNFLGGAITPIATTSSADFLNKPGYFLIDSIVTPYCATSTGSGSGASTSSLYAPSVYSDTGTRTTSNPAYAYDGNLSTGAIVSGLSAYVPSPGASGAQETPGPIGGTGGTVRSAYGACLWEGFANVVTTTATNLNVVASFTSTSSASGTITANIGSTATTLYSTSSTVATTTYTVAVPSGTNLNTVTVQVSLNPSLASSTATTSSGSVNVYEIFIQ